MIGHYNTFFILLLNNCMNFIDIILNNSEIKEAKLYNPSKKAAENPNIGITIQKPAAFHVIKDCATMASGYIPLFVFEHYSDPFTQLKEKIKREDIEQFVAATKTNVFHKHLLMAVASKAISQNPSLKNPENKFASNNTYSTSFLQDPYGEYMDNEDDLSQKQVDAGTDYVELLCRAFKC